MAAPVAAVQFTQGATVGPAGQALFGVTGTAVTVANGNNTNVQSWTFTIIDVPPGSTVPTGVVQSGASPTYTFTPDLTGGYHVQVTVTAADGTGVQVADDRVFGVQQASGLFIPPFKATDAALNFGGQLRGWAPYMEAWLGRILGSGSGAAPLRKTGNYVLLDTDPLDLFVDTFGSGGVAITMKPHPFDGQIQTFGDNHNGGSWSNTDPLTIQGNTGQKVENPGLLGQWVTGAPWPTAITPGGITYKWAQSEGVWLVV